MFDFMINFLHIILAYSNKAWHKINYKDLNKIFKKIPVMDRQYSKTSSLLEIISFVIITKIEAELLNSKFCRIL